MYNRILPITTLLFFIILSCACEKIEPERIIKLSTDTITNISYTSCFIKGTLLDVGEEGIEEHGFCYSVTENPTIRDKKIELGPMYLALPFSDSIKGLVENTTYYVRAFAIDNDSGFYGEQLEVTTLKPGIPIVSTSEILSIRDSSAIVGGEVIESGGAEVSERGLYYSTLPGANNNGTKFQVGNGVGEFSTSLSTLKPGQTYYIQAYATNSIGTALGDERSFTTYAPPTVTTTPAANVLASSTTIGGEVIDDGGDEVFERGVYYGTSPDPQNSGIKLDIGNGPGLYSSELSDLDSGTVYYITAFASNSWGTSFGSELTFTTLELPLVTTNIPTQVKDTAVTLGGNVISDGGAEVTERGIFYSTSPDPETNGIKVVEGAGTGEFTLELMNLVRDTEYFVKAYAINKLGSSFGSEVSLTTLSSSTVTDYDGNIYETVYIGDQVWMKENLKVTHYNDGSAIPLVTGKIDWSNIVSDNTGDAYCFYLNDSDSEHGALYTYAAALNACPDGWHLPSDNEWTELENYLADNGFNYDGTTGGDATKIAKAMAAPGGWTSSIDVGAVGNNDYQEKINASGFSALPGGQRLNGSGEFDGAGNLAGFWGSTEVDSGRAYGRYISYNYSSVDRYMIYKRRGFSVRCVKDE